MRLSFVIETGFGIGGTPSTDDSFTFSAFDVNYSKKPATNRETNQEISSTAIVNQGMVRIFKDGRGFLERNAVFGEVGFCFRGVPFEAFRDDRSRLLKIAWDRYCTRAIVRYRKSMASKRGVKAKRSSVHRSRKIAAKSKRIPKALPNRDEPMWSLAITIGLWKGRAMRATSTAAEQEVVRILIATLGAYARDDLAVLQKFGKQSSAYMERLERAQACEVNMRVFDDRFGLEFTKDPFPRPNAKGSSLGKKADARAMMNALACEMTQPTDYEALASTTLTSLLRPQTSALFSAVRAHRQEVCSARLLENALNFARSRRLVKVVLEAWL
jgi:hypothetical protein